MYNNEKNCHCCKYFCLDAFFSQPSNFSGNMIIAVATLVMFQGQIGVSYIIIVITVLLTLALCISFMFVLLSLYIYK